MLSKSLQAFAKLTLFKKTKNGYVDKSGYLTSESEITDYHDEVMKIVGGVNEINKTKN